MSLSSRQMPIAMRLVKGGFPAFCKRPLKCLIKSPDNGENPGSRGTSCLGRRGDPLAQGGAWAAAFFGGGRKRRSKCHWSVGEVGIVGSDFHRRKGATANESRKIASQIKRFGRFFSNKRLS